MNSSRRNTLRAAAGLAATSIAPFGLAQGAGSNKEKAAKPLSILILGGTGFTGPHQVRYALSRGHKITLFNRGRRPKDWPEKVEELTGDRETNDYASLKGRKWDVCIDNPTSVPHWIRDAAAVLKGNVKHYLFISTLSVYASNAKQGEDENGPLAQYKGADAMAETIGNLRKNMELYGPLKALSEDEVRKQFEGMATVVRPGLIVGPGDETDRFSYWPLRLARGGDVLVPPLVDPVQFVDGRDLAEWMIRLAEARTFGNFNAIGPAKPMAMGEMLNTIRDAISSKAVFKEATLEFLQKNKVAPWSELTLWVPGVGDTGGFHRRNIASSLKAGLTFRPLADTARDTLTWFNAQPDARREKPRAGLKAEREIELLKLLAGA